MFAEIMIGLFIAYLFRLIAVTIPIKRTALNMYFNTLNKNTSIYILKIF